MSRETRRLYEEQLEEDISKVPIFGQDNWQSTYHRFGVKLDGASEIRQKWYPAQAKPRTYYAMGGIAYNACRHLQDFFSDLINAFIPTHHIHRLRPDRLFLSTIRDNGPIHYRIYDLSSFTSNFREQRFFMQYLADFFRDVQIEIVDEKFGLLSVDLGDMLDQYNQDCVEGPLISIERFDEEMVGMPFEHGTASLLGIFGNLMSCTVAHYFIMSALVVNEDEINIAGDDGIVPEDEYNSALTFDAISLVGSCALEKTFRGDEEAVICLKRPFVENPPRAHTLHNIIPPSVVTAFLLLGGRDRRYQRFDEDLPANKKVSIIGKDLLRFLRSAHIRKYEDVGALSAIVHNFRLLIETRQSRKIYPSTPQTNGYIWPIDPKEYEFDNISPAHVLVVYRCPIKILTRLYRRIREPDCSSFEVGSVFQANMSPKMKLLLSLGYLVGELETVELTEYQVVIHYSNILSGRTRHPCVYNFTVSQDLPISLKYL